LLAHLRHRWPTDKGVSSDKFHAFAKNAPKLASDYAAPLPARLFAEVPAGFAFCEYLMPREEAQDALAALCETLGNVAFPIAVDVPAEQVFQAKETFADSHPRALLANRKEAPKAAKPAATKKAHGAASNEPEVAASPAAPAGAAETFPLRLIALVLVSLMVMAIALAVTQMS